MARPEISCEAFQNNLYWLMDINNLTAAKLGRMLEIDSGAILRWLRGGGFPRMEAAVAMARFFKVKLDDLICREMRVTEMKRVVFEPMHKWERVR